MKRKGSASETAEVKATTKRRKREKKSESDTKAVKKGSGKDKNDLQTKLDMSSPQALLSSIISPHTVEEFQNKFWEKKPLHVKRNDAEYYGRIFSFAVLLDILDKHKLSYEIDLNACRYVDGMKEMMNGDGVAKASEIKKLVEKKKATVQFHQPQRFSDSLWSMMEKLERFFGSHVGANVYITPAGTQGLAPHNDDIEAFVLQLEGKKRWKLYEPLQELATDYSHDLSPEEVGELTQEIELEAGDLLYFPRGVVHEAQTSSDGISTHVTLSTYQTNTWGEFLLDGISSAIEVAISKDVEFRRGLPLNCVSLLGTGKFIKDYILLDEDSDNDKAENGKDNKEKKSTKKGSVKSPVKSTDNETIDQFKSKIKDLLCRVVDHFDPNTVVDSRSEDFIANRLPPSNKATDKEIGDQPSMKSSIKLHYPEHVRLVVYEEDDDDDFDATAEEESIDDDTIEGDEDDEEDDSTDKEEGDEKNGEEDEEKPGSKENVDKNEKTSKSKSKTKTEKTDETEDEDMDAEEENDDDEDDILQGPHVRLLFSVHNNRETHMIGSVAEKYSQCVASKLSSSVECREEFSDCVQAIEPNAVKLPLHFGQAISYLLQNSSKYVLIKDLPLTEDKDKLELATTLWTEKLISVK
eukprot:gene387-1021_t